MANILIFCRKGDEDIREGLQQQLKQLSHNFEYGPDAGMENSNVDSPEYMFQALGKFDGAIYIWPADESGMTYMTKDFALAAQRFSERKLLIVVIRPGSGVPAFLGDDHYYIYLDDPGLNKKVQNIIDLFHSEAPPPHDAEVAKAAATDRSSRPAKHQYWLLRTGSGRWWQANNESIDKKLVHVGLVPPAEVSKGSDNAFLRLQRADRIIHYNVASRSIEAVLEVLQDTKTPSIFLYTIDRALQPPIPMEYFVHLVTFGEVLDEDGSLLLFPLTREVFASVLNADRVKYVNSNRYIAHYTTEGDHQATDDQLSFEDDIVSLGTVMRMQAVQPPLAIGLFGRWGSGKSFFMEKLAEHIDHQALAGYIVIWVT